MLTYLNKSTNNLYIWHYTLIMRIYKLLPELIGKQAVRQYPYKWGSGHTEVATFRLYMCRIYQSIYFEAYCIYY